MCDVSLSLVTCGHDRRASLALSRVWMWRHGAAADAEGETVAPTLLVCRHTDEFADGPIITRRPSIRVAYVTEDIATHVMVGVLWAQGSITGTGGTGQGGKEYRRHVHSSTSDVLSRYVWCRLE